MTPRQKREREVERLAKALVGIEVRMVRKGAGLSEIDSAQARYVLRRERAALRRAATRVFRALKEHRADIGQHQAARAAILGGAK